MSDTNFLIAQRSGLSAHSVNNTVALIKDAATIPFIARYRKEVTGNLDEVQILEISKWLKYFEDLALRKLTILNAISEQGKLSDELKAKIDNCQDAVLLEDLYLPYKKRRKTRADLAREQGLEPLAKIVTAQYEQNILHVASKYLNETITNENQALQGAKDIIAEWINEDETVRERLRETYRRYASIISSVVKTKVEQAAVYKDYFEFSEHLLKCPSHRFLAINRGANEGFLRVGLAIDEERAIEYLERKFIKSRSTTAELISEAIKDSLKRLIMPSVELSILAESKVKADTEAIKIFADNVQQLLMAAPAGSKVTLALDPGFRTGCKLVVLNQSGDLVHNTTIYPNEPQLDINKSSITIHDLVSRYGVEIIAIGNGTASRETQEFIENCGLPREIQMYVVNENGASIYSASDVAREEFPNQDITVRGAVSIGRRLMDPLAELVKIDAKSIGVGQYQHDVNQSMLKESLDQTVISCVNKVGINLNTASPYLLSYVSGLGPTIAANIVSYRKEIGRYTSRRQLLDVPRLGAKAYEQCAGFLRIREAEDPLDNTGVHPERYGLVKKMVNSLKVDIHEVINQSQLAKNIKLTDFISDDVGLPTLQDIIAELEKPGLDPRGEAKNITFDASVRKPEDLKVGMVLNGVVTNITAFGAFVDVGVKQDGMVHKSQIADKFVSNPADVLHLGQEVKVNVIEVDLDRKRINLTMKPSLIK